MFFQVRLFKGLFAPYVSAHQLNKAEQYSGIWQRTFLLFFFSLILSGISAYFGIGNGSLSKLIYDYSASEFETIKGLFGIGQVLQGIITTAILIFFPSLIFWVFTDIEYRKLVVVQLFTAVISLIEKGLIIPFQLFLGIDRGSSPFALGVMAQYVMDNDFFVQLFASVSIFSIWVLWLQFRYLRIITEKSSKRLLILILSTNLFIWLFTALFSYIKFEVFQ